MKIGALSLVVAVPVAVAGLVLGSTMGQSAPAAGPATGPASGPAATGGAEARPKAVIGDLVFLAGTWRGSRGGVVEEIWGTPQGNNIIGCFRWLKADGTPMMLEMLAITAEADAIRLRLRHYSATLSAKEEKDQPLTLRLATHDRASAVFVAERDAGELDRVTYRLEGDTLNITVAFTQGEQPRKPLEFKLERVTAGK